MKKFVYWFKVLTVLLMLSTALGFLQATIAEPNPPYEPLTPESQSEKSVITPNSTEIQSNIPASRSERITFYATSLSLGLINGATVGMGWNKPDEVNRDHTIYVSYYYSDLLWYSGVGFENKFYNNKNNFYTLITWGIDCGEIDEIFGPIGGSDEEESPHSNFYIGPHLTFGAGYRVNIGKDNHLFVEWDIGFKSSISNISIGMTF